MIGLRVRLMAATMLVAAVTLAAMAFFSGRVVQNEYRQLVTRTPARGLENLARQIVARGKLTGTDAMLEHMAGGVEHELAIADSSGAIAATSFAPLRGGRMTFGPGRRLVVDGPPPRSGRTGMRLELFGAERASLRTADGRTLGTLVALPQAPGRGAAPVPFLVSVRRGMWLGVIGAMLLALALVWLLSGRIVGPIESLTSAARRLEAGDLSPRVAARGRDEVAALAHAFNAMAEGLTRARDQRRRTTSDIAHELRTPLTNLRAQIEALQDGLVANDTTALRSLHDEVLLLARLAGDLEELALADAGALRLERSSVNAREALESAAGAVRARASDRQIALAVEADGDSSVRADRDRLAQILRNLLDNALTHTPAGGAVTLTARAASGGEMVVLTVSDSGTGIRAEHLQRVFDRFHRADPSRARSTGGTGLGLAIVKSLVEAHGGTVFAESEAGRGTRVTFTLPKA